MQPSGRFCARKFATLRAANESFAQAAPEALDVAQTFRDWRGECTVRPNMRASGLLAIVVALGACRRAPAGRGETDVKPAANAGGQPGAARLLDIENRRVVAGVTDEDISNPDPAIRRLAARALARLGTPSVVPMLINALSDEDGEVVSWAAHGLGYVCRVDGVNGSDIVRALVTRAATLPPHLSGPLDATFAITRGLGRCATEEAERALVPWLTGPEPRAGVAALALGDVASRRKTLAEGTYVALLAVTTRVDGGIPVTEALYPFGRLDEIPQPFVNRLLAAATANLRRPGPSRIFAIRALSRAGQGAVAELERVLSRGESYSTVERAEAARGLARASLGDDAQRALSQALPALVPARDPVAMTTLGSASFGPLMVALEALRAPLRPGNVEPVLYELARLAMPKDAPPTLTRRVVRLRCRAASLLVNGVADDPLLVQCDPDPEGVIGQRAQLEVIGRRPIEGRRLALYRKLVESTHARVREGAVELLAGHPEVEDTPAIVARALGAKEVGMVATAAEFVAAHPQRVASRTAAVTAPDAKVSLERGEVVPDVATKLTDALARRWAPDDVETLGAVVEAAGATRLDGVTNQLEAFCKHDNPTLREHAARALSLLKEPRVTCPPPARASQGAAELGHLVPGPVKLELVTDAGTLTLRLDPTHAPVTVTRVVDLVRERFYDGIVVHRVVPGFVVQFGDPGGDGFGGPGREPLRCETTPAPYGAFDVGVALAGRDTGSSQLFVTLARYPNLDQEYPIIGKADGDWYAVAEGDVIREVRVLP
jgi:cyclophilin family peptidyl-prolyl cis-trans isomerase/HEAT repeat protein